MWAYLDNARKVGWEDGGRSGQRRVDRRQPGIRIPLSYAVLLMAERFGLPPWQITAAPADTVLAWLNLMGLEAEIKDSLADLGIDGVFMR